MCVCEKKLIRAFKRDASEAGGCMNCGSGGYYFKVLVFTLGSFEARLCPDCAKQLAKELREVTR